MKEMLVAGVPMFERSHDPSRRGRSGMTAPRLMQVRWPEQPQMTCKPSPIIFSKKHQKTPRA